MNSSIIDRGLGILGQDWDLHGVVMLSRLYNYVYSLLRAPSSIAKGCERTLKFFAPFLRESLIILLTLCYGIFGCIRIRETIYNAIR